MSLLTSGFSLSSYFHVSEAKTTRAARPDQNAGLLVVDGLATKEQEAARLSCNF